MLRTLLSALVTSKLRFSKCVSIGLAVASGFVWCEGFSVPKFTDYEVATVYRGPVRSPEFGDLNRYSGTDLRCFGEMPSYYAAMPVNFAGHFVVDACSCGSGCSYLFLWDAKSGEVYRDLGFGPIEVGPYLSAGRPPLTYHGFRYRPDSNLLIADGCFEDSCDCATRYYVWTGTRFKLTLRHQGRKPPNCEGR